MCKVSDLGWKWGLSGDVAKDWWRHAGAQDSGDSLSISLSLFLKFLLKQTLQAEQSLLPKLSLPVISETSLIGIAQPSPVWPLEK